MNNLLNSLLTHCPREGGLNLKGTLQTALYLLQKILTVRKEKQGLKYYGIL